MSVGGLVAGAKLTIVNTEVFAGASPAAWTDLNLSAWIGAQATVVFLTVVTVGAEGNSIVNLRPNGNTGTFNGATGDGINSGNIYSGGASMVPMAMTTDTAGILEWITSAAKTVSVRLLGYIK